MAQNKLEKQLLNKGKDLFQQGKFFLAKQCFQKCLNAHFAVLECYYYLALYYYYQCNYPMAFKNFQLILASDPKYGEVYFYLGKIYQVFQNEEESLRNFKKALELSRNEVIQIASYEALEDFLQKEEKEAYKNNLVKNYLIQVESQEAETLLSLGLKNRIMGEYDNAIDNFLKLIQISPKYFNGYYEIAQTYMKKGDFNLARETLIYMRKKFRLFSLGILELARSCFEIGRYKESRNYLKQFLLKNPPNYSVFFNLGMLESLLKHFEKAIEYYLKCLNLKNDFFGAYYNLAVIYQKIGKADEALKYYQKALALNTNDENIYYNMGLIYFVKSDYINALFNFTKAYQINPQFEEAHSNFYYISLMRMIDDNSTSSYEFSLALKVSILFFIIFFILILLFYFGGGNG